MGFSCDSTAAPSCWWIKVVKGMAVGSIGVILLHDRLCIQPAQLGALSSMEIAFTTPLHTLWLEYNHIKKVLQKWKIRTGESIGLTCERWLKGLGVFSNKNASSSLIIWTLSVSLKPSDEPVLYLRMHYHPLTSSRLLPCITQGGSEEHSWWTNGTLPEEDNHTDHERLSDSTADASTNRLTY